MSWSFASVGKPRAVLREATKRIAEQRCTEPEERIKAKVGEILSIALEAFPLEAAVEVTASGSQSKSHYTLPGENTGVINQLSITIKPLWGFVE